jgi:sigma-B regulation protein RsbU (phosphoserine phosphatase)
MDLDTQAITMLRNDIGAIILGTLFLVIGLISWAIAAIRRRSRIRILIWLGVWTFMYGMNMLALSRLITLVLPGSWIAVQNHFVVFYGYFIVVAASFALLELSLGMLRRVVHAMITLGTAIGVAGYSWFLVTGSARTFELYDRLLTVGSLSVLAMVMIVPKLSRKYLLVSNRRILAMGSLLFVIEAVCNNVFSFLHIPVPAISTTLGFAAFLLAFAYSAVDNVVAGERRLLAIENELEIARGIQRSILPGQPPQIRDLRIAAGYYPMTAVAGDFYDFIPVDEFRAGFLLADVAGHGVPAALIASMLKVAIQSCTSSAQDPAEVLKALDRSLSGQLHGQLVSAAYLWIDSETHIARYSAAGHPPLLFWRAAAGDLRRIESNGLLFGVLPNSDYPVCEVPFRSGDCFLLYTDGVMEAESSSGEAFGDRRLEQVLHSHQEDSAARLLEQIIAGVHAWQAAAQSQQDDMTLLVIEAV